MLEQFEIYISAQKTIANYMMGFGVILILLAIVFHFVGVNSLFSGLKIGCLILGLFSAVSGFAHKSTEKKLLVQQTKIFKENTAEFKQIEKARMQKVVKNFPIIQIIFVSLIIGALISILFIKNGFVSGFVISLILLLLGNMIIENVSKTSIDAYYHKLVNP